MLSRGVGAAEPAAPEPVTSQAPPPPRPPSAPSPASNLSSIPDLFSRGPNNSSKPKEQKGKLPDLAAPSLSRRNIASHAEDKAPARVSVGSGFPLSVSRAGRGPVNFFFFKGDMAFEALRQECTVSGPNRRGRTFLTKDKGFLLPAKWINNPLGGRRSGPTQQRAELGRAFVPWPGCSPHSTSHCVNIRRGAENWGHNSR